LYNLSSAFVPILAEIILMIFSPVIQILSNEKLSAYTDSAETDQKNIFEIL